MEAADDISYLTADLEDSVEKGILSLDEVYNLIKKECKKEGENFLLEVIEEKYQKAKKDEEPYQFNMFFTLVRAQLVTSLVFYVVDIYLANHEAIFHGEFNSALLEYDKTSQYYQAVKILQNISAKHIYQNREVQELELQGYTIINGLLNIYKPLLELSAQEFSELLNNEKIDCFIASRLIKRVSSKQIVAYQNEIKELQKNECFEIVEFYHRTRLIIDFISGMTDDFALYEYQTLLSIK